MYIHIYICTYINIYTYVPGSRVSVPPAPPLVCSLFLQGWDDRKLMKINGFHTYVHAYACICIRICMCICMHMHVHMHAHACICMHMHA